MSNLSNVCLSIRSSNNKTSTARGYASNGKALVSFTNKGGVNMLKAYPKADKVPSYLLMDEKEYTAYGNAIKYVYNSACHVNASTTNKEDESIIKVYTTDFHSCLSDLANIVFGETFSMQEYPSFGTEVLAMAKTYLTTTMDGDVSPANLPINRFVKALEPMLLSVAAHSVFLKDYERDYNLACKRCNSRINKATAQLDKAQAEYDKALSELDKTKEQIVKDKSDSTIKASTKKTHENNLDKAQKEFDAKKSVLDTIKNTIDTWKIKLADAEKTYKAAKAADSENS